MRGTSRMVVTFKLLLALAVRADSAAPSCTPVAGAASLLSAVADAEVGCVALATGVYALPSELRLDRSVRLIAQPGATPTISGARNGGSVTVSVGLEARVELVGLRITGGNNTHYYESLPCAGGVHNLGTLVMVDCEVYGNIGESNGGGVSNSGNLTMHSCAVHGNRFPHGCGLLPAPQGGDCIVNRPVWQSSGEGGGIRSSMEFYPGNRTEMPMPVLTLIDSRVFNNTAGMGGGIVVIDTGVTLVNSSVYNNTAAGDPSNGGGQGGGILHNCQMACRRPNSTLVNSSVFNNTASLGGGTALSGSISTGLTGLSWICVGIHSRGALPSPVCA